VFDFFKKKEEIKEEVKSLPIAGTATTLMFDSGGNFIGQYNLADSEEINDNISVNTIINKQLAIICQPEIVIKKSTSDGDVFLDKFKQNAAEKPFHDFIKWIYNPNTYPSPSSKDHIIKYLVRSQYKNGIYGVIFSFSKADKSFNNIILPQRINLQNNFNQTIFRAYFNSRQFEFKRNAKINMFYAEDKENYYLLQVDGNYNNETCQYESEFESANSYIKLQNLVARFSVSFYKNSCFPSQIVSISYEHPNKDQYFGANEKAIFDKAIEEVKEQMKLSQGKSANIVLSSPYIKLDIKPLNIPANATEISAYDKLAAEKIFGYVDGGSFNVFMGVDEYSGNAITRAKGLYDATFRTFKLMCLNPMTQAMRSIARSTLPSNSTIDVEQYSLDLDTSGVRVFQEAFLQMVIQLIQNNLYQINEGRDMLAKMSPEFRGYGQKDDLNVVNAMLSGNKTKPAPDSNIIQ
jgi:hypothetical protein